MQRWEKLGRLFYPDGTSRWMKAYAAVPTVECLEGGLLKIYFSARDQGNRSHTGWLVIDINCPDRILDLSSEPVLAPGKLGCFDDSGTMATWLCEAGGRQYLYYIGWNLGQTVPFRNAIGLAVREPGGIFSRIGEGPIMDRSLVEPHFCASCCVLPEEHLWRMWYLNCVEWRMRDGKPEHRYHIKYAESEDGIHWQRNGTVAIDFQSETEYAISRPSVVRDRDCWRMWYSFRGKRYRIGYAESENGIDWNRLDRHAGIDVSDSGWDSEMIEYPQVFDFQGQRFMLYNGNDYGKSGFGLAVLKDGL